MNIFLLDIVVIFYLYMTTGCYHYNILVEEYLTNTLDGEEIWK